MIARAEVPIRRQGAAARRLTRAQRSRRIERATLYEDVGRLRKAGVVFRILSRAVLMRVGSEVAVSRARELCLAYHSVISVAAGYKLQGDKRGKSRLTKTPCVVFVVRRKWPSNRAAKSDQTIPRYLAAFATVDGRRVFCAVPTDVVPQASFVTATAHSPAGLVVRIDHTWNAACAARLKSEDGDRTVLISCQHVL